MIRVLQYIFNETHLLHCRECETVRYTLKYRRQDISILAIQNKKHRALPKSELGVDERFEELERTKAESHRLAAVSFNLTGPSFELYTKRIQIVNELQDLAECKICLYIMDEPVV